MAGDKMNKKYKVQHLKDNTYKVLEIEGHWSFRDWNIDNQESIFQGTIVECEAFIRLKEKGQI